MYYLASIAPYVPLGLTGLHLPMNNTRTSSTEEQQLLDSVERRVILIAGSCMCNPKSPCVRPQAGNLTVLEFFTSRVRDSNSVGSFIEVALDYARIILQVCVRA